MIACQSRDANEENAINVGILNPVLPMPKARDPEALSPKPVATLRG